jgi:hypothetical protein
MNLSNSLTEKPKPLQHCKSNFALNEGIKKSFDTLQIKPSSLLLYKSNVIKENELVINNNLTINYSPAQRKVTRQKYQHKDFADCDRLHAEFIELNDYVNELHGIKKEAVIKPEKQLKLPKQMSGRTKAKIQDKLKAFFIIHKIKHHGKQPLIMLTLTLTSKQLYEDSRYNKMLNNFLTIMRKKYQINYLWVAEKQNNGNIHYHIIVDRYVNVTIANATWCKILNYNGHDVKMPKTKCPSGLTYKETQEYFSSKNCSNPVDVKYLTNSSAIGAYLTKYITKNKTSVDCQIWNCSKLISNTITAFSMEYCQTFAEKLKRNNWYKCKKTGEIKTMPDFDIKLQDNRLFGIYTRLVSTNIFPNYADIIGTINHDVYKHATKPPQIKKKAIDSLPF